MWQELIIQVEQNSWQKNAVIACSISVVLCLMLYLIGIQFLFNKVIQLENAWQEKKMVLSEKEAMVNQLQNNPVVAELPRQDINNWPTVLHSLAVKNHVFATIYKQQSNLNQFDFSFAGHYGAIIVVLQQFYQQYAVLQQLQKLKIKQKGEGLVEMQIKTKEVENDFTQTD